MKQKISKRWGEVIYPNYQNYPHGSVAFALTVYDAHMPRPASTDYTDHRQTISVRAEHLPIFRRIRKRARQRNMTISQVTVEGFRLWLKYDERFYGGPGLPDPLEFD